jgi:hypothetical protein
METKRLERETQHTEFQNAWSYTSNPPFAFMARRYPRHCICFMLLPSEKVCLLEGNINVIKQ